MKKKFVFLSLLFSSCLPAISQLRLTGLMTVYSGRPTDNSPVLAISSSSANATYETGVADVDNGSLVLRGRQAENITVGQIFDTAGAHLFVIGQKVVWAENFEYRVMKNSTETLVPWRAVLSETVLHNNETVMNHLGNFKAERGSFLVVDLRKKGADSLTASAIVYFRRTQPTLSNIYLGHEMKQFMKKLSNPDASPDSVERLKWKEAYSSEELDSKTALPKKLNLASDQNSIVFFLKEQVQKGELLEYQVNRNGEVFSNWRKNEFDNGFVWLTNLPPGNYELRMRFTIQPENVTTFPFRIRPRWDQTFTFRLIAGGLLAAFFGFLLLLVRLQWQRQKLRRTQAQRDKAETDLRAIYSQLNPHFIFNALSSIQALVNRNDAEHANHYLSSFSKLLRASLVNSERALVPLSRELEMLENYLQLEQLRFPFEYTLEAEEDIVASSVVVPSLLLQPLVENAIKHGVSGMQKRGVIRISFSRTNNDIVINITDNGTGFDTNSATNGYGLKLTKERIRLLNEGGGEQQVSMFISSEAMKGTSILVQFKNWL